MNTLFHFHGKNTALPINGLHDIFNNIDLYNGTLCLADDASTTIRRKAIGVGNAQLLSTCGKLTAGFAKALSRAAQVNIWPNCGDGYGIRYDSVTKKVKACMANYTVSSQFTTDKVNLGMQLSLMYEIDSRQWYVGDENGAPVDLTALGNKTGCYSEAFIFALWGLFLEDEEFRDTYNNKFLPDYKTLLEKRPNTVNRQMLCKSICKLADIAYYMLSRNSDNPFAIEVETVTNATRLTMTGIIRSSAPATPTEYHGKLTGFITGSSRRKRTPRPKDKTAMDLANAYTLNAARKFTKEEQSLMIVPNDHTPSAEAYTLCEHIQASSKTPMHIRNILLRGAAGTGKTETAKDVALGLGLPYTYITCSAETEIYDLLGQMMPNENKNQPGVPVKEYYERTLAKMPSATDISMDPEIAYKAISGTNKAGATELDCLVALMSMFAGKAQGSEYHYVESPLVKAIRNGWVCEIQEPTVIAKPGTMVGLNGLLDSTAAVNLPTGETVRRHPDSVIIATTNITYEGCRDMNQSILSRFQLKLDFHEPDDSILADRLKKMTGCPSSVDLNQMLKAYHSIQNVVRTSYLNDGSVDIRALANWVASYMVIGDYRQSAEMTIIPSATADEEGLVKVRQAVNALF